MAEIIKIIKRNGEVAEFDPVRIRNALGYAMKATDTEITEEQLDVIVNEVVVDIETKFTDFYPNVENVQDLVEKYLMKHQLFDVAKHYILYRAKRQKERDQTTQENIEKARLGKLTVKKRDGRTVLFDFEKVKKSILRAAKGYKDDVSVDLIGKEFSKNIFDGITTEEIDKALVLSAISYIERDPAYSKVSARLFLQKMYKEVCGKSITHDNLGFAYRETFVENIKLGVKEGLFDQRLLDYNLEKMSYGLKLDRDELWEYLGIQTIYERYLTRLDNKRIELPQGFWMRVAMGLALNEEDKESKALDFYETISALRFVPSTPTLFHAGTAHPQLSSCYLTTVGDDLGHIFKCLGDNAQLSKWSGGLGNDWTSVRATGAFIKSTNVESQGIIPFLKIANDVTVAINRSGKRRGATCAYLETWHLDVEDFLDLRRNTGDDRRRTHDMNTANWIPDVFMKRVQNDEPWTLFSPDEVPDLHEIYGRKFEKKYMEYEEMARNGKMKKHKVVSATKLWRKMLTRLFETGHPWVTFKDPCNIRSPQDHTGVVHSSNLCTEITLNTSPEETAVCNLGSINLAKHVKEGKLHEDLIAKTVKVAMRMLDNVIDLNFYPTTEAKNSNMRHRPIGLGVMGFQDALFLLDTPFESPAALKFSDNMMEMISYHAVLGSSELAKERGRYPSFEGSKWDRGIFPLDTLDILEDERGLKIDVNRDENLDWSYVREHVKKYGMRNSNCMAIAPTATISNIAGCFPCIEPIYKNIYVKANISGEFTIVNHYLVNDLKKLNLWNNEMLEQLKYYDGNVQMIPKIPQSFKDKYKEAFEVPPDWLVKMTSVRSKWIDQSQSHNVFMRGVSGKKLADIYMAAWNMGLKTTYYLRTLAATQVEKSTLDASKYGFTQKREYGNSQQEPQQEAQPEEIKVQPVGSQVTSVCSLMDPDCEACQ